MTIVTMLMVPATVYFMSNKSNLFKGVLLVLVVSCGMYLAIASSYFSFGPYKQSLQYLQTMHPDIKKIVHVNEVTAGPLVTYNNIGSWQQYYMEDGNTVTYTNLDVFDDLTRFKRLHDVLNPDEVFCLINFENSPLNPENHNQILSQSRIIQVDSVVDNKSKKNVAELLLYILKYIGNDHTNQERVES